MVQSTHKPYKKLKVGIFGITGCMGCILDIVYQPELLTLVNAVDIVAFPRAYEVNEMDDDFDIIFLEGVVVNEKDLEELKHYRIRTKKLIAIGACACEGCVPAIKNFLNNKNVELSVYTNEQISEMKSINPKPIDEFVKVDGYIRGCPMDKVEFYKFIKATLLGKDFKVYQKPICYECNLQETGCLLEKGMECLGPITFGNCSVMCPHENYGCIGCRGPYEDANYEAYFKMLENKGVSKDVTFSHINRFAGIKFQRGMDKKSEELHQDGSTCCYDMFCSVSKDKLQKIGDHSYGGKK